MCIGLDWDKDGESLAILMADCSIVFLWDLNSKKLMEVRLGTVSPILASACPTLLFRFRRWRAT